MPGDSGRVRQDALQRLLLLCLGSGGGGAQTGRRRRELSYGCRPLLQALLPAEQSAGLLAHGGRLRARSRRRALPPLRARPDQLPQFVPRARRAALQGTWYPVCLDGPSWPWRSHGRGSERRLGLRGHRESGSGVLRSCRRPTDRNPGGVARRVPDHGGAETRPSVVLWSHPRGVQLQLRRGMQRQVEAEDVDGEVLHWPNHSRE
mmetsp:Transcript_52873/g.146520  ORF Transcript_52873/g.146520 Transcript_52873/m.146520 type:complete len:205 (-) Transcript_52873:483-1097(-)